MQRRRLHRLPERCVRGHRGPPYAGARSLLRWLLANLAKVNGTFLRSHGHGIEALEVRELCDISYALITEGIERDYYARVAAGAKWEDATDPLGDMIVRFEERVGLRENPEAIAFELHKQLLKSRGIEWDDTPVGAGSGQWWDQDVEFTDMSDLDKTSRRRKGGNGNLFLQEK